MTGDEARVIVKQLRESNHFVEYSLNDFFVSLQGTFTLEEVQAILYLMEHKD